MAWITPLGLPVRVSARLFLNFFFKRPPFATVSQISIQKVTDSTVLSNKMIKADHIVKAFDQTAKAFQRTNHQVQQQRARMAIGRSSLEIFEKLIFFF